MPIFNSLGSNYSKKYIFQSLGILLTPFKNGSKASQQVVTQLEKQAARKVFLTYKGRHAISLALTHLGLKPKDPVAIQGFTCWAVEEALHAVKAEPVFVDITKNSLNPSLKTLKSAYKKNEFKYLVLQHTFGFSCEVKKIETWCAKKKIAVIHDLAHAYGSKTNSGKDLQTGGDAVAYSFGRDKVVDAISGGAVAIDKGKAKQKKIDGKVSKGQIIKDLLYPGLTADIRYTYSFGLGKVLHFLYAKLGWLSSPIANSSPKPTQLPDSHIRLLQISLSNHDRVRKHRQKIAKLYQASIDLNLQFPDLDIDNSSCLRFPIRVNNRKALVKKLKNQGFLLADTWFKDVVEKGRLSVSSSYQKGMAPKAELLSQTIFNLPTHINISESQARDLSKLVNIYAESL